MMFGVHGGEQVGGRFMPGLFLLATPRHEQAVAETPQQAHPQPRMRLAHSAEVVVMRDVQTLAQAAFDAPGGAMVFEPLGRAEFLWRQALCSPGPPLRDDGGAAGAAARPPAPRKEIPRLRR